MGCVAQNNMNNGLTQLMNEPKNCEYLYSMTSKATTYKQEDAYAYIEQSIVDQGGDGDSYLIESEEVLQNNGGMFAPEHTYKFKVKVYNCNK